jgi:cation-transporting ATPase E
MTVAQPTHPRGLTSQQVEQRRAAGLVNHAPTQTTRTYGQILRENVFTFINNVLFLLGLGLVLVGRPVDALISVGVIATNILVSVVQEVRAKRTLDKIALLTRPQASVVRESQVVTVAPEELVQDDVLKVGPGDQILVDGSLLQGQLMVDESQLTGESDHVPKKPGDPVYSGSFCVEGTAYYVAEKVGEDSFANQLTAGARAFRRVLTPLQRQINLAVRIILLLVVYMELLLFANGLVQAVPLPRGVQQATVVAGLVPNGLFVAIAVAYALGAVRIVRYGALVQQSNAIESLCNVDVLCLDKTGTLTTNRLRVFDLFPMGMSKEALGETLGTMVASASTGNKTSEAVAHAFRCQPQPVVGEVAFSSDRKWSAVAFADASMRGIYILGAPAVLQPYVAKGSEPQVAAWEAVDSQAQDWARQGLRVLLIAHHPDATFLEEDGDRIRLPSGITPSGLVSLSDELRPEAKATLASFIRSGVNPKIISGDDPETVASLAKQAGLEENVRLVSGLDLEEVDERQFRELAETATIFGRITPQQKERLVDALHQLGHYVAMIGDGVNDVLCLKKADLGIAMQSGTQATRSVADIILLNDSFAALAPAVAEGQRIVNGMQDILKLFLTRIATMTLLIMSALVIGVFPINLRHASLVTMLTVGIPVIVLAVWARPGYRYRHGLIPRLIHFVVPPTAVSSLLGLVVFYGPYLFRLSQLEPGLAGEELARGLDAIAMIGQTSLATFLLVTGLLLIIFVEPPTRWWAGGDSLSGDWRPTVLASSLLVIYVVVLAIPSLRSFFELQALSIWNILLIIAAAFAWLVMVRLIWRRNLLEWFFEVSVD